MFDKFTDCAVKSLQEMKAMKGEQTCLRELVKVLQGQREKIVVPPQP